MSRVLVASKKSILDLQGEFVRLQVERGHLSQSHLDRLQRAHDDHHSASRKLLESLKVKGVEYVQVAQDRYWPNPEEYDAVFAVGGDGTVLEASHHIPSANVCLIGLRSSPMSVGHLCYGGVEKLDQILDDWLEKKLPFTRVQRLKANVRFVHNGSTVESKPVLNDFLYTNQRPAETTRYKIDIGSDTEVHKSSGIWIATSAGSTAAIGAAGGTKCEISESKFQYLVRELYQDPGKSLHVRSGFFNFSDKKLMIENRCEAGLLALDGQHEGIQLRFGDQIEFLEGPTLRLALYTQ